LVDEQNGNFRLKSKMSNLGVLLRYIYTYLRST